MDRIRMLLPVLMLALACSGGEVSDEAGAGEARSPAPDFSLRDLNGGDVTLADFRGKVVIVDFWATWCPPCIFQVPELNKLHEAHRDRGDVVVIGIAVDVEGAETVGPWVQENAVAYTIALGDEKLAHQFGAVGFPTMAVVSPDGRIDSLHVGLIEYDALEELVEPLLPASI